MRLDPFLFLSPTGHLSFMFRQEINANDYILNQLNGYIMKIISLLLLVLTTLGCSQNEETKNNSSFNSDLKSKGEAVEQKLKENESNIRSFDDFDTKHFATAASIAVVLTPKILEMSIKESIAAGVRRSCINNINFPNGVSMDSATSSDFRLASRQGKNRSEKKYAYTFYILKLVQEGKFQQSLDEIEKYQSKNFNRIKYKYRRLDDMEAEYTYFSNQTLNNIIGIQEYSSKLEVYKADEEKLVDTISSYMVDRNAFLPIYEIFGNSLDIEMIKNLDKLSSKYKQGESLTEFTSIRRVWHLESDIYFSFSKGEEVATIKYATFGDIESISGDKALSKYGEFLAGIDYKTLAINDLDSAIARVTYRECKKREYKESLKGYFLDVEKLNKAYKEGKTVTYVNEYAKNYVINNGLKKIHGEIPFQIGVKVEGDSIKYELSSPCGFKISLGSTEVAKI